MIIQCICGEKKFEVNSDLIPSNGRNIQCGSCDKIWFFNPNVENLQIKKERKLSASKPTIDKKKEIKTKNENINLNLNKKKKYEVTKYQVQSSLGYSKFLSYILVSVISFVAMIILIDTFKSVLYPIFPNLELTLFSLFETLKDIQLFIKDLI